MYKKSDWWLREQNTPERNKSGYTKRHKVRLFFGIVGQRHDGKYLFKAPGWSGRNGYTFMRCFGNPLLNFLIGYEKIT